jgi:hypothetical protein
MPPSHRPQMPTLEVPACRFLTHLTRRGCISPVETSRRTVSFRTCGRNDNTTSLTSPAGWALISRRPCRHRDFCALRFAPLGEMPLSGIKALGYNSFCAIASAATSSRRYHICAADRWRGSKAVMRGNGLCRGASCSCPPQGRLPVKEAARLVPLPEAPLLEVVGSNPTPGTTAPIDSGRLMAPSTESRRRECCVRQPAVRAEDLRDHWGSRGAKGTRSFWTFRHPLPE